MNQIFTKPKIKLYSIFQSKTLLLYKISKFERKLLLLLIKKILKHALFGVDVRLDTILYFQAQFTLPVLQEYYRYIKL